MMYHCAPCALLSDVCRSYKYKYHGTLYVINYTAFALLHSTYYLDLLLSVPVTYRSTHHTKWANNNIAAIVLPCMYIIVDRTLVIYSIAIHDSSDLTKLIYTSCWCLLIGGRVNMYVLTNYHPSVICTRSILNPSTLRNVSLNCTDVNSLINCVIVGHSLPGNGGRT